MPAPKQNSIGYAAEVQIKVGFMRTWVSTVFDHHWTANRKGTANQIHERADAVQQRDGFICNRKRRQYQNLVWHHTKMADLAPHLFQLAAWSRRIDAETDLCEEKLGDKVQAELMRSVYVYTKAVYDEEVPGTRRVCVGHGCLEEVVEVRIQEEEWVELHVDFLHMDERWRYHPYWGGAMSVRCDLTKVQPPPPRSLPPSAFKCL
jgi:hypothetical protein